MKVCVRKPIYRQISEDVLVTFQYVLKDGTSGSGYRSFNVAYPANCKNPYKGVMVEAFIVFREDYPLATIFNVQIIPCSNEQLVRLK